MSEEAEVPPQDGPETAPTPDTAPMAEEAEAVAVRSPEKAEGLADDAESPQDATHSRTKGSFERIGSQVSTGKSGKKVSLSGSSNNIGKTDGISALTSKNPRSSMEEVIKSGSQTDVKKAASHAHVKKTDDGVDNKTLPSVAGSKTDARKTSSMAESEAAKKAEIGIESAKKKRSKDSEIDRPTQGASKLSLTLHAATTVRSLLVTLNPRPVGEGEDFVHPIRVFREERKKATVSPVILTFLFMRPFRTFPENFASGHLRPVHQVRSSDPTYEITCNYAVAAA